MKLFHLSHIDLDGYGCQWVSSHYLKDAIYYNSNYGNEISARLSQMVADIRAAGPNEPILALITDLNLTTPQCQQIDSAVAKLQEEGYSIELQLLDHHITGKEQADNFEWYELDTYRCATLMTYDWFHERFGEHPDEEKIVRMVMHINAVDLWLPELDEFEFGKALMRLVSESKEIPKVIFPAETTAYKIALIEKAAQFMQLGPKRHIALDDASHGLKKEILRGDGEDETIDNLTSRYIVKLLSDKKDELKVYYRGKVGILTTQVPNISVIGNDFLMANPDIAFIIDLSNRGTVSLRSSDRIDVSQMAKQLFDGGGHPNAAGGRLKEYKEQFDYTEMKRMIQSVLGPVDA